METLAAGEQTHRALPPECTPDRTPGGSPAGVAPAKGLAPVVPTAASAAATMALSHIILPPLLVFLLRPQGW